MSDNFLYLVISLLIALIPIAYLFGHGKGHAKGFADCKRKFHPSWQEINKLTDSVAIKLANSYNEK
ncbi:MAG: hypothetical protein V4538_02485 [Bacteroidota bacterium]